MAVHCCPRPPTPQTKNLQHLEYYILEKEQFGLSFNKPRSIVGHFMFYTPFPVSFLSLCLIPKASPSPPPATLFFSSSHPAAVGPSSIAFPGWSWEVRRGWGGGGEGLGWKSLRQGPETWVLGWAFHLRVGAFRIITFIWIHLEKWGW